MHDGIHFFPLQILQTPHKLHDWGYVLANCNFFLCRTPRRGIFNFDDCVFGMANEKCFLRTRCSHTHDNVLLIMMDDETTIQRDGELYQYNCVSFVPSSIAAAAAASRLAHTMAMPPSRGRAAAPRTRKEQEEKK